MAAEAFVAALQINPGYDKARKALRKLLDERPEIRVRVPSRSGGVVDDLTSAAFHVVTLGLFSGDDD